ncbi:MAG: AI-2E family transporter [Armatimonadota bacterium]
MRKDIYTNHKSWLPLGILVVALALFYLLWEVLIIFILAGLFAFIIHPIVAFFDRWLKHIYSIIIVYLLFTIVILLGIGLLAPVVISQFQGFVQSIPDFIERGRALVTGVQEQYVGLPDAWQDFADEVLQQSQQLAIRLTRESIPAVLSFFTGVLTLVFVPLLAFFMLLDYKGYKNMILAVVPRPHRRTAENLLNCMGRVLWNFIRGEFVLMVAVGVLVGVGLYLVGMPYALVFGVIAGLLELIPSFGPVATTIIVGLVALVIDPILALKAVGVTVVVQALENALLVPLIMSKAVGLDPVTVAFAIFIGGFAAGILGAIIAVPIAMMIKIVILYFYVEDRDLPGREKRLCRPQKRPKRE